MPDPNGGNLVRQESSGSFGRSAFVTGVNLPNQFYQGVYI